MQRSAAPSARRRRSRRGCSPNSPRSSRLPRLAARVASLLLLPQLCASEITDGNVNFSFCVESADGKKVFIKQAQGFLKGSRRWRSRWSGWREVQYFVEAAGVLGGEAAARFLPSVSTSARRRGAPS